LKVFVVKVAPGTRTIILYGDGEPVYENGKPVYSEPRLFHGEWGLPKSLPDPGGSLVWHSEISGLWTDILILDDAGNIVAVQPVDQQYVWDGVPIVITVSSR
jgi:hypothetical protein